MSVFNNIYTENTVFKPTGLPTGTEGMVVYDSITKTLQYKNDTEWTSIKSTETNVINNGTSTDNAIARFDLTTGKIIQDSVIIVDDTGNMVFPINASLSLIGGGTSSINAPIITTRDVNSETYLNLWNGSNVGIEILDGTTGSITLSGTSYTGQAGEFLQVDASGVVSAQPAVTNTAGTGTDNAIARFDANGNTIQNSSIFIDDSQNITGVGSLTISGGFTMLGSTGPLVPTTASSSTGVTTTEGGLYWDTTEKILKVYNGTEWVSVSSAGSGTLSWGHPIFTGITTSGITVSTNSTSDINNYWKISDGNLTLASWWHIITGHFSGQAYVGPTGISGTGIIDGAYIVFANTATRQVANYQLWRRNDVASSYPVSWQIIYSQDSGGTWQVADHQTEQNLSPSVGPYIYTLSSPVNCTNIGIQVYKSHTDNLVIIQELQFNITAFPWIDQEMISYTSPAPNIVTASSVVSVIFEGWRLFNSARAVSGDCWHSEYNYTANVDYSGSAGLTGIANTGEWCVIDVGANYIVSSFVLYGRPDSDNGQPVDFDIVYSNDGSTWQSALRVVGATITTTTVSYPGTISPPINARYWGIQVSKTNSQFVMLSWLDFN